MDNRKDGVGDFTPLTPIMEDESKIDAPRAALADAERLLRLVQDLVRLGTAGLPDPQAALREAERIHAEKKSVVDTILDNMLNNPGEVQ